MPRLGVSSGSSSSTSGAATLVFTDSTLIAALADVESPWLDFQLLGVTKVLITRTAAPDTYGFQIDWSADGVTADVTETIPVAVDTSKSKTVATRYGKIRVLNTDPSFPFTVHTTVVTGRA